MHGKFDKILIVVIMTLIVIKLTLKVPPHDQCDMVAKADGIKPLNLNLSPFPAPRSLLPGKALGVFGHRCHTPTHTTLSTLPIYPVTEVSD